MGKNRKGRAEAGMTGLGRMGPEPSGPHTVERTGYNPHSPNSELQFFCVAVLVPKERDPALGTGVVVYEPEVLFDSIELQNVLVLDQISCSI